MITTRRALVLDAFIWLFFAGIYDAPIECSACDEWNRPQQPFRVFGNSWYVGPGGVASILIETEDGLVLLDAGLPQSAQLIVRNIETLGFDPKDIRVIGLSHAHFDHAGGIAALQRLSGATVVTSPDAAITLRTGELRENDPQFVDGQGGRSFPPVENVIGVADGWEYRSAGVTLTGLHTPGHTVGGMSWTWQSCDGERCLDIAYIDSLSPVSRPDFRFSDGLGADLEQTIKRIATLDCDIFLSTHDFSFDLHRKLKEGVDAFIDDTACRRHAERAKQSLDDRLARESAD